MATKESNNCTQNAKSKTDLKTLAYINQSLLKGIAYNKK